MPTKQPILLNSCARAATAEELRFRIDGPEPPPRSSRVIALDPGALDVVEGLHGGPWRGAHLLSYEAGTAVSHADGGLPDVVLRTVGGEGAVPLSSELDGADMVVMVATASDGADAAAAIGEACYRRGIMTGGVVFADGGDVDAAITALRPHAQVLLVTRDRDDLPDVLTALRV